MIVIINYIKDNFYHYHYICNSNKVIMSRNNEGNIKKHNDKLHKSQEKAKQAEVSRKEKLKQIAKLFNDQNKAE